MRSFGNIIWHIPFLGFLNALLAFIFGGLLTLTVVAAPIGLGLVQLGKFFLAPFGHEMVKQSELGATSSATPTSAAWQTYSTIVMIVWLPFGLLFALLTIFQVAILFLSIIGIPVAMALAKTLGTIFNPVGRVCVSSDLAAEIRSQAAKAQLATIRA